MVSPTGPTRLALFLLCCMGTWLSVHMRPSRDPNCRRIVKELKNLSEQLLKVQEDEVGLPTSPYPLPPFTHHCQPQHLNSSAILPYFKAIEPFVQNSTVIEEVIQQLRKFKTICVPDTEATVPTVPSEDFTRKWFISTVLREFSLCLKLL